MNSLWFFGSCVVSFCFIAGSLAIGAPNWLIISIGGPTSIALLYYSTKTPSIPKSEMERNFNVVLKSLVRQNLCHACTWGNDHLAVQFKSMIVYPYPQNNWVKIIIGEDGTMSMIFQAEGCSSRWFTFKNNDCFWACFNEIIHKNTSLGLYWGLDPNNEIEQTVNLEFINEPI